MDILATDKNAESLIDQYRYIIDRYHKIEDERLMAIIGALIVEDALDDFLSAWLINFKKISDKLSYNAKEKIAISSKLIPKKILEAIKPVRQIRNYFAHDKDADWFRQLREKKDGKEKIDDMYAAIKTFNKFPFDEMPDSDKDFITFKELCFFIAFALNIYSKHIIVVRDYIWKEKNLDKIVKSNKSKLIKEINL
jgi:hypothetical protein